VSFLHAMWKSSTELAGYSQQDAHEFFIALLNQIHATTRGSTAITCVCIVHSTFAGSLQSDVKCGKCGNVVPTVDPVLDISLELRAEKASEEITLASCLRRSVVKPTALPTPTALTSTCFCSFTQPEKLGVKSYKCEKCATTSSVS
jgi:ubiquitin carboxyl-terminal hydrolase 22/27/51